MSGVDYKHRIPGNKKRKPAGTTAYIWWVGAGAVVAAGMVLAFWLWPRSKPAVQIQPETASKPPAQSRSRIPPPQFGFFKTVPGREIIIHENDLRVLKQEQTNHPSAEAAQFRLQLGSFNGLPDAKKLNNRLSQLKLKASIEGIQFEGVTWFRISLGPFANLADLDQVRVYLRNKGIDSAIVRTIHSKP